MDDREPGAGPVHPYAWGKLDQALARLSSDSGADALAKVRQWRDVVAGIAEGRVVVGSRVPVAGVPAWVTPEVAHGGFATGALLAEVAPTDTELAAVGDTPGSTARERVNLWHLGDEGQARLLAALAEGRYRVEVPEDAALAVVALLFARGHDAEAVGLVAELVPFLHRLRFTPLPAPVVRTSGTAVRLRTAADVAHTLRHVQVPGPIAAMRATLGVWTPLYDRLVALWCETVDGPLPTLDAGAVVGGWPATRSRPGWAEERARWIADFDAARREYGFTGRHSHPRSNFARLREALLRTPDPAGLDRRELGWVRRALANTTAKNGVPGSAARDRLRAVQAEVVAAPTRAAVAHVVARRVERLPGESGIAVLEPLLVEVRAGEGDAPEGTPVPDTVAGKLERALEAPIDELVRRGVIGSAETLAAVLPQLTARMTAASFTDPVAAGVHEALYLAFRRRRGLLLLDLGRVSEAHVRDSRAGAAPDGTGQRHRYNTGTGTSTPHRQEPPRSRLSSNGLPKHDLAHQVRFEELPWARALEVFRAPGPDHKAAALRVLGESVLLTLTAFPHTITPNPLVAEFAVLAKRAGLRLPLVEEVAADIFERTFTAKWRAAATVASTVMADTLYARYYDLPPASYWDTPPPKRERWRGREEPDPFTALCERRTREAANDGDDTAGNGAMLEQSQILTTHNLAVLVDALHLDDRVRELAPDLAARTLRWVVRELAPRTVSHHACLIQAKNAAYAWRQAIFLMSFCDPETQERLVTATAVAGSDLAGRLDNAVAGLRHAVQGGRFSVDGFAPDGRSRRFLGWTRGQHWATTPPG
ncbi:hypothetical protein [Actinokineospora pegani]|uniref:hypothetical protein n=1 Tax=Actinokineospora pegani TaxID=2654637 RepID=UPI0012EAD8F5|nr:hypothetical protein [Actinokineospora pegani]